MLKFILRYTFLWSFALGALLAILLSRASRDPPQPIRTFQWFYEKWFESRGLQRIHLSMDEVRYGQKQLMESEYLYNHVSLLCVLLVRKRKNALAANQTWAQHCNSIEWIYLETEKKQRTMLPIRREKISSSWQFLCEGIRHIPGRFMWTLFVYDDTFALPENVRYMVAGLDANKGHYLGHALTFWGVEYNTGQAGYVLSRGSLKALRQQFNSTEACVAGGRFWRQEDWYLGKHLGSLDIKPADTRDSIGLSTFHGQSLMQMHFPGSSLSLSSYYKRALFPVKCCSANSVTFHTAESDKMWTTHYLLYTVGVFASGNKGNKAHAPDTPDEFVWKGFLREHGYTNMNISAEAYFQIWKQIVNDPEYFNQNIKKWINATT